MDRARWHIRNQLQSSFGLPCETICDTARLNSRANGALYPPKPLVRHALSNHGGRHDLHSFMTRGNAQAYVGSFGRGPSRAYLTHG